jgi:hypothetical protein
MKSTRGLFAGTMALLLAASATVVAAQQAWPNKPVKFIVPSAGGSSPDRVTRMLALRLAKKWGQPVIVENKAGRHVHDRFGFRRQIVCRRPHPAVDIHFVRAGAGAVPQDSL